MLVVTGRDRLSCPMYDLVTDFEPSNGRPTSDYVLSKWESCNDRVVSLVTCALSSERLCDGLDCELSSGQPWDNFSLPVSSGRSVMGCELSNGQPCDGLCTTDLWTVSLGTVCCPCPE